MDEWIGRAYELVAENRPAQALALLDEVDVRTFQFFEARSCALSGLHRFLEAEEAARLAGEAGASPDTMNYLMAWARLGRGDNEGALSALAAIERETPESIELTFRALWRKRDRRRLRAWLARQSERSQQGDARLRQGASFLLDGDPAAKRELETAFALGDSFAGRLLMLAKAVRRDHGGAVAIADRLVEMEPGHYDFLCEASHVYFRGKKWEKGLALCERAAALSPDAATPVSLRIRLLWASGQRDRAFAEAEKHWPRFRSDFHFSVTYGVLFARRGKFRRTLAIGIEHLEAIGMKKKAA